MRSLFLLLFSLFCLESAAQPILEIESHLKRKSFEYFRSYIDSLREKISYASQVYWPVQRQIVDKIYEECVTVSILKEFDGRSFTITIQ